MLAAGSLRNVRLFRNNVGNAYQGTPVAGNRPGENLVLRAWRRIQYGLFPGSGDLIGWKTVTITPEMVGQDVAIFVSIECKSPTGTIQANQVTWMARVRECGGIAGIARSPEDALKIIQDGIND
jgi:hypothetical protein